ncbi:acyl-ACP--UDP-N-acetylglucosamine O-acyltransferase [Candidatus Hydrogenedentota bacterium]
MGIHPSAIVDKGAKVSNKADIGPYSVVGPKVRIEDDVVVGPHVVLDGSTTIGNGTRIFSGAAVGVPSQDKKYDGNLNTLVIGRSNVIREYVTINPGSLAGTSTIIGSGCLLMAYSHVAHDCVLEDDVIMANSATLAGHIHIESCAIIGGLTAVHQFVRVGRYSIAGGCSKVTKDVLPYAKVDGHPTRCFGLNTVGLKRRGLPEDVQKALKAAFKLLFRSSLNTSQALARIESDLEMIPEIENIVTFIRNSKRGICK